MSALFEPSHRVMDLAHEMQKINAVKHIDLSMCTTRRAELEGAKVDKSWKVDASGYLRERQELTLANVDLKDLLAFRQALTRRSIMMDVADITSFEAHEDWADLLLECVQAEQIPGFNRVSLEQALRADKEIWHRIAGTCRDGVRRSSAGDRPVQNALQRWQHDPLLRIFLAPLPGRGSSSDKPPEMKRHLEKVDDLSRQLKAQKTSGGGTGSGKGNQTIPEKKGKGKGKAAKKVEPKKEPASLPEDLKGMDWKGRCWDFNRRGGSARAAPGGSCPKGSHMCMYPGCTAGHSLLNHR